MFSPSVTNPWVKKNEQVERLTAILDEGERFGLRAGKLSEQETEEVQDHVIEKSPSLLMINLMKSIRQKQNECDKIALYIQKAKQAKHTSDILDMDVLEERIQMLQDLNLHLDSIIQSKDLLLEKLQQPHTGDYLEIEAQYRKEACEVIANSIHRLGQLSMDIDNLNWINDLNVNATDLQALVKQSSVLLAQLQTNAHSLSRLRSFLK